MVYLEDVPDYDLLEEDLAWERTFAEQRQRRWKGHPLHNLISGAARQVKSLSHKIRCREAGLIRRYVSAGRVLDVGCGDGRTLKMLHADFVPCGIEVSRHLAAEAGRFCESRGGFIIRDNAIGGLGQVDREACDGVLMISFLEHERQPKNVLLEVGRVLKPGGAMLLKVPNHASWNRKCTGTKWCGYRFPDHVNYFTPATLRKMIEACRLEVIRFRWSDRLPTSDCMWMVAGRR